LGNQGELAFTADCLRDHELTFAGLASLLVSRNATRSSWEATAPTSNLPPPQTTTPSSEPSQRRQPIRRDGSVSPPPTMTTSRPTSTPSPPLTHPTLPMSNSWRVKWCKIVAVVVEETAPSPLPLLPLVSVSSSSRGLEPLLDRAGSTPGRRDTLPPALE